MVYEYQISVDLSQSISKIMTPPQSNERIPPPSPSRLLSVFSSCHVQVMGFMDLSPEVTLQTNPPLPAASGSRSQGGRSSAAGAATAGGPAEGASVHAAGTGGGDGGAFVSKHFSALQTVEGFLDALTNASRYIYTSYMRSMCEGKLCR